VTKKRERNGRDGRAANGEGGEIFFTVFVLCMYRRWGPKSWRRAVCSVEVAADLSACDNEMVFMCC
jgi:hypothetical protein